MPTKTKRNTSGLAVVDLIIVSVCLTIISSLAMPYLLSLRSATRTRECAQRIRNITLGSHFYHDANRRLPPATIGFAETVNAESWSNDQDSNQYWQNVQNTSSLVLVSPYLEIKEEVEGIHKIAFDLSQSLKEYNDSADEKFDWQGEIAGFEDVQTEFYDALLCPEDNLKDAEIKSIIATQPCDSCESEFMDRKDECKDIAVQYWPSEMEQQGQTNYVACFGVVGAAVSSADAQMMRWRGAMSTGERITLEGISDGTSRTLMYGESMGEIIDGERKAAMSWSWGGGARLTGNWPFDSLDRGDDEEVPMLGNSKYSSGVGFGGVHENSVIFSLCDGSVRAISKDVNRKTLFELAGARDGGVPLNF